MFCGLGGQAFASGGPFAVTYDPNGGVLGTVPDSQQKLLDAPLTLTSEVPTRTGFAFLGWATSKASADAGTVAYAAGSVHVYTSNANLALFAVWTPVPYTVTFDANAAGAAVSNMPASPQNKAHGASFPIPSQIPVRSGFAFRGWAVNSATAAERLQPGESYTADANVILFAVWAATFTVTYNANEGTGAPGTQTKVYNEPLRLSDTRPTRAGGYAFRGWSEDSNATTAQYQPGETVNMNRHITLHAVWVKTYTVTYNANTNAVVTNMPNNQTKIHGETLTLSATTPRRVGHKFLGWAVNNPSGDVIFKEGGQYTANADAMLFAVWQADGANSVLFTFLRITAFWFAFFFLFGWIWLTPYWLVTNQ
jgi:uncharacterized repeat protein (TIGR02543 family)